MPSDHDEVSRQLETARDAWRELAEYLIAAESRRTEMVVQLVTTITHTVVVLALIAAAVILSVTGNDAQLAWGALAGYIGAGAVQKTSQKVRQNGNSQKVNA